MGRIGLPRVHEHLVFRDNEILAEYWDLNFATHRVKVGQGSLKSALLSQTYRSTGAVLISQCGRVMNSSQLAV